MNGLQRFVIAGYNSGLQNDRKPFLLPDKAFQTLQNAYVWRERVRKRECLELVGRLRKLVPLQQSFGNASPSYNANLLQTTGYIIAANNANPGQITTPYPHNLVNGNMVIIGGVMGATGYNNGAANPWTITVVDAFNFTIGTSAAGFGLYTGGGTWFSNQPLSLTEPNAEIVPGSIKFSFNGNAFTDNGNGILSMNAQNFGTINYQTGEFQITTNIIFGPTTLTYYYYPGLPVMGIESRELSGIIFEQTIFFDTKYAYTFDGTNFNDINGVGWTGSDSDFFWTTNYAGVDNSVKTFYVTNNFDDPGSPMRYTMDAVTFTTFQPQLVSTGGTFLLETLILIPYYGRLIALNTIEGPSLGNVLNKNFFSRARFSQEGNPLDALAWVTDVFGRGGFADAPTSESIVSATLFKNTLIVRFERSTWQLRFVGNYGQPFLWERISSDFGSESTFSSVLFDSGDLTIGDRAITVSTSNSVARIDDVIPDLVFTILNNLAGPNRVQGIRDFRRELVFWCYTDGTINSATQYFPNTVLVYNYRNQTFAQFSDNVTAFGNLQPLVGITWDSTNVTWDDEDITWDTVTDQSGFARIASGNASGFIHFYGYKTPDDPQNQITAINITTTPITITVPNHNIGDSAIIYITGLMFLSTNLSVGLPVTTTLNNTIYRADYVDDNTLALYLWDNVNLNYYDNFAFLPASGSYYIGGGEIAIFPVLDVVTKDFNPFTKDGKQIKVSSIDFLMDVNPNAAMTVNLFSNTYPAYSSDMVIGQTSLELNQPTPYFGNEANNPSDILWHRLYFNLVGQLIRIELTFSDVLLNQLITHQNDWVLNAMTIRGRPGGNIIF